MYIIHKITILIVVHKIKITVKLEDKFNFNFRSSECDVVRGECTQTYVSIFSFSLFNQKKTFSIFTIFRSNIIIFPDILGTVPVLGYTVGTGNTDWPGLCAR